MRSLAHFSLAALHKVPFGILKRLANCPRLYPATKSRGSSSQVCLFNRRMVVSLCSFSSFFNDDAREGLSIYVRGRAATHRGRVICLRG